MACLMIAAAADRPSGCDVWRRGVPRRLPPVSGQQLITALGWVVVRQRGSHICVRHPDHAVALMVPFHREPKRQTPADPQSTQVWTEERCAACCPEYAPGSVMLCTRRRGWALSP